MAIVAVRNFSQGRTAYLLSFLGIWSGYFSLIAIFNFTSKYDNFSWAIAYQCLFIALSLVPVLFLPLSMPGRVNCRYPLPAIWISLSLSVLGVISLLVDKMANGVDYTAGICTARYQMNQIAALRNGGISSIYSVFGNLFATSFFVAVAVAMIHNVSRRTYYLTFSISFALLMLHSTIASSRSPIMLFGAFFLSLICLRALLRRPIRIRKVDVVFGAAMAACALLFIGAVFGCRASLSQMTSTEYQASFAPFLGVEGGGLDGKRKFRTDDTGSAAQSLLGENVSGIVGVTALYVMHSAYTFAGIISMPPEKARIMFTYPMDLMARIGIVQPRVGDWALAGRFASTPGGLYHDFGLSGLFVGSLIMGVFTWLAMFLLLKIPGSIVLLGVASMMLTIMFLSPMHFAAEFAIFPFVCFSFIVVAGLVGAYGAAADKRLHLRAE